MTMSRQYDKWLRTVLVVCEFDLLGALICFLGKSPSHPFARLSTDYINFRTGLFFIGAHPQNTCIGNLSYPLNASRGATGLLLTSITILLLCGCAAILYFWRQSAVRYALSSIDDRPLAAPASELGGRCCRTHIEFAGYGFAQAIAWP
jgi:hypothetical protein